MPTSQSDVPQILNGMIEQLHAMLWLVALLAAWILFNVAYKRITGRDFAKPRKERREARKRRKIVLWEYERDR